MKRYEFELKDFEIETFFPHFRIKKKTEITIILMEACRFMLLQKFKPKIKSENKIVLLVDKTSRLFFFKKNKYYSIFFPFNVLEDFQLIEFNFRNILEIDAQSISFLVSLLKDESFNSESCFDFAEPIYNMEKSFDSSIWIVLKELLFSEDGYIRYDVDKEGYLKAKAEKKEHQHPEHHYDIFYKSSISLKLGLHKNYLTEEFIDSINSKADCHYLKSYN